MPPAACSLRLLGPPELRCGSTVLLLEPQRSHQLLAYLALRADWVRREQLAALFWPERGEAAARSNLRKVILLAHQTLEDAGATAIEDHGGALRWCVSTDVTVFLQSAERGLHADAVGRYGGPLMRGLDGPGASPFADWLQFERERLAARWRDCVFSAARATDDPAARAEWAARLLARDPLDEAALRLQLSALSAAGRHADALNVYRNYASNLAQETGLEPSAEIRMLCAADEPRASASAAVAGAAFFGRTDELHGLQSALRAEGAPPQVIVGPGGVGKSRLLAELVRQAGPQLKHGAFVVGLHDVHDAGTLAARIARTLGVELPAAGDAGAALCDRLHLRSLLLGLDGFEHLVDAVPLITQLHAGCPGLRLALTSRVRPGIAGERVIAMAGLTCPSEGDTDIEDFDAVRLFAHHARRASPAFDVAAQAAHVSAICRLIDGLPLALELAASWVRLFRCEDIAADLRRSLDLLRGNDAAASVTAILEQTWSLLVPQERQLLPLLAVFRGGFDAEAVRAVADMSLAVVAALVDKSLVRSEAHGRMSLHPLVRHFAEQRLLAGDAGCTPLQARQRHAEHYARVLDAMQPSAVAPDRTAPTIRLDFDNFCALWDFAVATRQAAIVDRAARTWASFLAREGSFDGSLGMLSAGDDLLRQTVPPRAAARATLLMRRGSLRYRVGDLAGAEADGRLASELAQSVGSAFEHRRALNLQGIVHWARGDHDQAQAAFEHVLADLRAERDDIALEANVVGNLGLIAFGGGEFEQAHRFYAEALALHRQVGSEIGVVQQLMNLGSVCLALQQWREVVRLMGEALALARTIGHTKDRPYGLHAMAQAHLALRELTAARSCCESALALIDEGAERLQRPIVLAVLCEVEVAEGRLDAAADALRGAALAAHQGALAHDQVSVIQAWASLLLAQQRAAEAAILWSLLATHSATLADQRTIIRASLARLREHLSHEVFAACERKAATLRLEPLLAQAASLLAPTP